MNNNTYKTIAIVLMVAIAGLTGAAIALYMSPSQDSASQQEVTIAEQPAVEVVAADTAVAEPSGPQLVKLHATVQSAGSIPHRASQGSNSYGASHLVDGSSSTCWCITQDQLYNEIVGDGPMFTFNVRCSKLDHIVVHNGYGKNSATFNNNSRFTSITVFNADASNWNVCEPYEVLVEARLKDSRSAQTINIPSSLKTNNNISEIGLYLGDLVYGSKYPEDVCLSEIEFWGYE